MCGVSVINALQYSEGIVRGHSAFTGTETFSITGITALNDGSTPRTVQVTTDTEVGFDARVRIDTPAEADYFRHGGILPYVLRSLL